MFNITFFKLQYLNILAFYLAFGTFIHRSIIMRLKRNFRGFTSIF